MWTLKFCYKFAWTPVFWTVIFLQQTSAFQHVYNVTRRSTGDYFTNPDTLCDSSGCANAGGFYLDYCNCQCSYGKPTFLVNSERCEYDAEIPMKLSKNLPKGLATNGSIFRLNSKSICTLWTMKEIPVLDLRTTGSEYLCTIIDGKKKTDSRDCKVVASKSRYLYEYKWREIWPSGHSQEVFTVVKKTKKINQFKWTSALGQKFNGLIFALHISCNAGSRESVLIFKTAGSRAFNGVFPTLSPTQDPSAYPSVTTGRSPPLSTDVPRPSIATTTVSSVSPGNKGKTSQDDDNQGLVIGLSVVAVIVVLVLIVVVIVVIRYNRRKQNNTEGPKAKANPTYGRGADLDIHVNGNSHGYDTPVTNSGYQPLVHNTRIKDSNGRLPVYHPLTTDGTDSQEQLPIYQPVATHNASSESPGIESTKNDGYESVRHEYESVKLPVDQQATASNENSSASHEYDKPEEPEYADPAVNDGPLYAVSNVPSATQNQPVDFSNPSYSDPDKVLPLA